MNVVTHVIAGLPGEKKKENFIDTVRYVADIGSDGIKLRLLHVLKGTDLALDYEKKMFRTLTPDEYLDYITEALSILPPDMVIHRVTGDGPKDLLIAPLWSANKRMVLNSLHKKMKQNIFFRGNFITGNKEGFAMPNGSITIYKLIILYTLSKVDSPLPPGVISDYITDRGYTNYFNLQNAFGELLEADLIKEDSTYHLTYYTLTEAGAETLELFGAPLSREIRDEINHYLEEHKFEIIDDTSLVSDYHATNDGTYLATCTLRDGNHVLMRLSLDVATEADAIKVCENWQSKSDILYQTAMQNLLS